MEKISGGDFNCGNSTQEDGVCFYQKELEINVECNQIKSINALVES